MRRSIVVRTLVAGLVTIVLASGGYFAWKVRQKADQLQVSGPEDGVEAVARIAKLDAKAAVPELVSFLAVPDEELRLHAAMALGGIGEPAVPALLNALDDPDKTVRFYTVWALAFAGPAAKSAVPAVIKAMSDKDEDVRYKAAFTLGRVGTDADEAVAALIGVLNGPDPTVRQVASASLVKLGARAVGPLRKALADRRLAFIAARTLSTMASSQDEDHARAALVAVPDILRIRWRATSHWSHWRASNHSAQSDIPVRNQGDARASRPCQGQEPGCLRAKFPSATMTYASGNASSFG